MSYINIVEKMKLCFPKWMDIRRKTKNSTGGNLLYSIAEEADEIKYAIDEYRKEFFIDNYIDRENEIVDFLYKANIGITEIKNISINGYTVVDKQDVFYDNSNMAYYEDGFIFIKEDLSTLLISVFGKESLYDLEKSHVWNIFDEFATFIGIRRYENETNKELLNRLLAYSNGKANCTEDGLKHAIISDLINIDSNLTNDDILIERQTASSLVKYYNNFETILDKLSSINRDTFREKQWDIDSWKIDVNKIDYIPHAWDVAIASYSNGIGFEDDLKVKLVDDKNETDVQLSFYKNKIEAISAYIQNNNIKQKMNLTLKQFDSDIVPDNVKYKIEACAAKKIDTRKIEINSIENTVDEFMIPIKDVADPFLFGVQEEDMSVLDSAFNYSVNLVPIDPLKEFFIEQLEVESNDGNVNLINYNQSGFEEKNGGIKNSKTRAYIRDKYMLSRFENVEKIAKGFVINDLRNPGKAFIDAGKHKNKKLYINYECEKADVLLKDIKMNNCYLKDNKIVADTVNKERSIEISLKANSVEFFISGNFSIQCEIESEGVTSIDMNREMYKFSTESYSERKNINVKILFNEKGESNFISGAKFAAFDVLVNSSVPGLMKKDDYYIIPNNDKCEIEFLMNAYTGFSPCINYIYIGEKITESDGIQNININTNGVTKINAKVHNCRIDLIKKDKETGNAISIINDFKPFVFYSSISNSGQVELFLDSFDDIESMEVENGSIETISYNSDYVQYVLKINIGHKISHIKILGKKNAVISKLNLYDVLSNKNYKDTIYDFYCSKSEKSILAINKYDKTITRIFVTKSDICKGYNVSRVSIDFKSDLKIVPLFIESNSNVESTGLISNGAFDLLSFVPSNIREYIAINEYDVIFNTTSDIDIVNTFNNNYSSEKELLLYKVSCFDDNYTVKFQYGYDKNKWENISIGTRKLSIQRKDINSANFNFKIISIDDEYLLSSAIEIPREFLMNNNEKIDIRKYIILNNYNITYLNKYLDMSNKDSYIFSEKLLVDDLKFSKLKYSNIYEIESIHYSKGSEVINLVDGIDYKIHYDEGIITWLESGNVPNNAFVNIIYNIKIARAINIDIEDVYKKIEYNTLAYEKIGEMNIDKVPVKTGIDLRSFDLFHEADLTNVKCKDIGFEATVTNGVMTLEKVLEKNTVAVKSGFYYMNGVEHYLFANEKFDEIEKMDNLKFSNVEKIDKQFIFRQPTVNSIANSSFELNSAGDIHILNCLDKDVRGASVINSITACDSFNYWKANSSILSIAEGYNGVGIKYSPVIKGDAFCYLCLNDFTEEGEEYTISYYIKNKSKSYLGKETAIYSNGSKYNKQGVINIYKESIESQIIPNIFSIDFKQDDSIYYLILEGNDIIDDILITKKSEYDIMMHVKNVTGLNLDISENIYSSYSTRFLLSDKKSSEYIGTEMRDGCIVNSSFVHWGYTVVKSFNDKKDFQECALENVELAYNSFKCAITTGDNPGAITTKEIFLGNIRTINNVVVKINDIMSDSMKGFKVKILTAQNSNSDFKEIQTSGDNLIVIDGKILSPYIKIVVEMPSYKVINNIDVSVEYLSEGDNRPADKTVLSGTYITKIHDAQYSANYKITNLGISNNNRDIKNYIFYVRATKENTDSAVWTDWKQIELKENLYSGSNIDSSIIFENYRFFQFKAVLKGADTSIKIDSLDLEVI